MNIFVTSRKTAQCAAMLDDVRLRKMIVESCQMLSTVMRQQHGTRDTLVTWTRGPKEDYPVLPFERRDDGLYMQQIDLVSHPHHPCTIWSQRPDHFIWHVKLLLAMLDEYEYRFDKQSKCIDRIPHYIEHINVFFGGLANYKPPEWFQNSSAYQNNEFATVFEAYQQTMLDKWESDSIKLTWTRRERPDWRPLMREGE